MMKNDYRRSLILLRSNASGYSGHVRLERRTMMGTMYFLVQSGADCPALRAALVGRDRSGNYYACAVGEMKRDDRGQAVMGYSFDPRNICGRELEQYQLIAITCAGDESCQVVLFGNVCGHAEFNWDSVGAALRAAYGGSAGSNAQPAPVTELPEPTKVSIGGDATSVGSAENAADVGAMGSGEGSAATAGELLEAQGVELSVPWPEAAEPLRTLFQNSAPMKDAPDGECVYVEAPMPEGSGFPFVAAGLLALGGALAAVRYALPAAWSDEPPEGLEECAWVGDQNRGWWVSEVPLD